ncbi:hypothetical protein JCM5296_006980 [Sporobolomyces johnsonii]
MLSSPLTLLAALFGAAVSLVFAQQNHQIVVGGSAGLVYTPSNISAAVGDTVTFVFQAKNHTVTQSSFAAPCQPLVNASTGARGFDSGYVPVASDAAQAPAWTVQILTSGPIWFYCAQTGHCGQGMVGSINAAVEGNKTFADFKALALGKTSTGGGTVVSSGIGADATGALSTALVSPSSASASVLASRTGTASKTSAAAAVAVVNPYHALSIGAAVLALLYTSVIPLA